MSISLLIIGGNSQKRLEVISKKFANKPFIIKPTDYSIEAIRNLQKEINRQPPYGNYQLAIILEAQNLTIEAQNCLLKTLEEPPEKTQIVLTAPTTDSLLPTIASRCQIISLPFLPEVSLTENQIAKLKNTDISTITTRDEAIEYVEKLLVNAEKELLENTAKPTFVRKLLKTRHYLKSNTHIYLTLANLFLN